MESLVRNAAFVLMVVRLVNVVQKQGTFWVTTAVPGYFALTAIVVVIWLVSVPAWPGFVRLVMGVADPQVIVTFAAVSIGFYILFAFNNVADSVFYGRGRAGEGATGVVPVRFREQKGRRTSTAEFLLGSTLNPDRVGQGSTSRTSSACSTRSTIRSYASILSTTCVSLPLASVRKCRAPACSLSFVSPMAVKCTLIAVDAVGGGVGTCYHPQ